LVLLDVERSLPRRGNRTRSEILAHILDIARGGALKTHIMYKANLSHKQLLKYLTFLESNGLLQAVTNHEGKRCFQITEKGMEFLKEYTRLSNYFGERTL
jgi:predicted transcriptional regulator